MIRTERLALREPNTGDAAFLARLMNEPDWLRFIGDRGVRTEQDAAAYVEQRLLPPFREHGFGLFVVEPLPGGAPLGICGLVKRPSLDTPDLGFAFLSEHRGRGYAVESGRAVLADAQRRLGLERVLAITHPDNHASVRVLERLGLTAAGTTPGAAGEPPLRLFAWQASSLVISEKLGNVSAGST